MITSLLTVSELAPGPLNFMHDMNFVWSDTKLRKGISDSMLLLHKQEDGLVESLAIFSGFPGYTIQVTKTTTSVPR